MAYFSVKFAFMSANDKGVVKQETEQWLFVAETYTEAESVAIDKIGVDFGDFEIKNIKPVSLSDVIGSDSDSFWLTKVQLITINEKSMKEEKFTMNLLVRADDIDNAVKLVKQYFDGGVSDYSIISVSKSGIVDFYK